MEPGIQSLEEAEELIKTLNSEQMIAVNYLEQEVRRLSKPLAAAGNKTIKEIFETMTDDQENAVMFKFEMIFDGDI